MLADDFSDMEDPLFRAALQSIVKPDVKDEEYTVEDKKKDFNQDEEYTVEDKKKDFNKSDEGYTVEEKKEPPPWSTPGPLPPPPLPPPSPPPIADQNQRDMPAGRVTEGTMKCLAVAGPTREWCATSIAAEEDLPTGPINVGEKKCSNCFSHVLFDARTICH